MKYDIRKAFTLQERAAQRWKKPQALGFLFLMKPATWFFIFYVSFDCRAAFCSGWRKLHTQLCRRRKQQEQQAAAMHVKRTEQRHAHQQACFKNIQTTQLLRDVPSSNWLEDDYSQLCVYSWSLLQLHHLWSFFCLRLVAPFDGPLRLVVPSAHLRLLLHCLLININNRINSDLFSPVAPWIFSTVDAAVMILWEP